MSDMLSVKLKLVCFAPFTASLPEQVKASNYWPEPVWSGGLQQPEEAGAQGGGCVHGP